MKRAIQLVAMLFLAIGLNLPLLSNQTPNPGDRANMWKKVDQAIEQGLPKTAIEELKPILEGALAEKAYPEAIKALTKRIVLEGQIEGGSASRLIARLQPELDAAAPEMKPTLHAIMGYWYWSYFQGNRWRFANRTATAAPPSDDFTTWDLKRLFAEIDRHNTAALADPEQLQKTPIESYAPLLIAGDFPDSYRPTLYDFLAHEAIEFYASGEQAGTLRDDAFEIEASSPILGSLDDFLAWTPKTSDEDSPKLKAIRLYQALLRFHASDEDPSARLDADLGRLRFGFANAVGEEKNSRTLAALKQFANTHASHPLSATARARWAEILRSENDLVAAHEVATQGRNAFPESVGGKLCHNLIVDIESPSVTVQSERVWNDPWPSIRVRYRNIDQIFFRAIRADWASRFARDRWRPDQFNRSDIETLIKTPAVAQWSEDLPETEDFQEATHDVAAPKTLAPGYYLILHSQREDFGDTNNAIGATEAWVSNLAIVVRQQWNQSKTTGFVLNNQTGEPIANAKVRSLYRENNAGTMKDGPQATTDANGLFEITLSGNNAFLIASHNGHELATGNEYSTYPQSNQEVSPVVAFFTDRSIYRPGQTIQFKGVVQLLDPASNRYQVVKNRKAKVDFLDPNGQIIETLELISNDYGSFSGSFTAPRNRGTGRMTLLADGFGNSATQISVEEYKRPKFQVTMDDLKSSPKLGDTVQVSGKATSYTGAAIQGSKVRYRVVRQVRWPDWFMLCYGWRIAPMAGQSQEIAHGWTETKPDGSFELEFVARPDRSIPESDQPSFNYSITVDVTDGTGETRSGQSSISVGYTTLQANLTADSWQTSKESVVVRLSTSNLNGVGLAASGTIRVHRLKEPDSIERSDMLGERRVRPARTRGAARPSRPAPATVLPDRSNMATWALGEVASETTFNTLEDGKSELRFDLKRGPYRLVLETQDRLGKSVKSELNLIVLDDPSNQLGIQIPHLLSMPKSSLQPGETWRAIWGTGYQQGRAYVEIEHRGKILQQFWTPADRTQTGIEQAVDESMRGGFTVRVTYVRDNRAYLETRTIEVPWINKQLHLSWGRFRSKLEPGVKETWSLKITGKDAETAAAELVAGMFDASLDAYLPHAWPNEFQGFYRESSLLSSTFQNYVLWFNPIRGQYVVPHKPIAGTYRRFPENLRYSDAEGVFFQDGLQTGRARGAMPGGLPAPMLAGGMGGMGGGMEVPFANPEMSMAKGLSAASAMADGEASPASNAGGGGAPGAPSSVNLGKVSPRTNLNETAFFFPHLRSNADGVVTLEFTLPEALTTWRFMGFAHDQELRSGSLFDEVISAKDLMVQPNPPRFLREGDTIEFSAKVTNQSNQPQLGKVALQLSDAIQDVNVDAMFGNSENEQTFDIPAKESRTFRWKLNVPDGAQPILYQTVAATETMSDGEQGMLPVLSNRVLVTESIPLPIRGKSTKEFELKKLLESGESTSIRNQSLTVQMTSQPAWYAVLALPYLMEYPYDCSEQTFNRLYANSLARHIANSDPKIARVFESWRQIQPEALVSPLIKNEDLKSIMIEETPWLRDANRESQSRRNVGILFDRNRLDSEVQSMLTKLAQMQRDNGMWPWFPGGPDNEYLSLYIVTGFGRLRNLGVPLDESMALRALDRLDAWMHEAYDRIVDKDPTKPHLSPTVAFYLYGRSFFINDKPIDDSHSTALAYWKAQSRDHWVSLERQSQAHIAVGMHRLGDKELPTAILKSLKERSVTDEELGMFWRDTERSWWWYQAPIETQAMMIEAFDEVTGDQASVEECKVWLLKQKQTTDWKTTKATADAVYALIRRGGNWLSSDALVTVKLADTLLVPEKVEAGTGFYEQRLTGKEILPEMGRVTVTKPDAGVSWGSLHWQYLEDISKITAHEGTPLKLEKQLFQRVLTGSGPVLEQVTDESQVEVGDELVCRIVLRTDRDMEYVHMKDYRGSGTEPTNVLSSYKFQDGLAYYESTRDTATHFFIDYLRKGTYVFEYTLRVQHAGDYPMGYASIQCMYAPEFNSHSQSVQLHVK
jgi:uncharacterized protein YfaS (alpha-2-macroglobulin family)